MTEARQQIQEKLAHAKAQLDETLEKKKQIEKAVTEAEATLEQRQEALAALAEAEGTQRGHIGDLKRMLEAFDDAP